MNRENLKQLADYLAALPVDYRHFSMAIYHGQCERPEHAPPECGTVACAAGHGPSAGIPPRPDEHWTPYSFRAFFNLLPSDRDGHYRWPLRDSVLWSWCFSWRWEGVDNTPQGAAKRIRFILASEDNIKRVLSLGDSETAAYWRLDDKLGALTRAEKQLICNMYRDY